MGAKQDEELGRMKSYAAVGSAYDTFDMHNGIFPILAGYHTTLKIWPSTIAGNNGIDVLDMKERKCKFDYETNGKLTN